MRSPTGSYCRNCTRTGTARAAAFLAAHTSGGSGCTILQSSRDPLATWTVHPLCAASRRAPGPARRPNSPQTPCQFRCVLYRLPRALPEVGRHRVGRVAKQRNPAFSPLQGLAVVDDASQDYRPWGPGSRPVRARATHRSVRASTPCAQPRSLPIPRDVFGPVPVEAVPPKAD